MPGSVLEDRTAPGATFLQSSNTQLASQTTIGEQTDDMIHNDQNYFQNRFVLQVIIIGDDLPLMREAIARNPSIRLVEEMRMHNLKI